MRPEQKKRREKGRKGEPPKVEVGAKVEGGVAAEEERSKRKSSANA